MKKMAPEKKARYLLYTGCGAGVGLGMGIIKLAGVLVNHLISIAVGM